MTETISLDMLGGPHHGILTTDVEHIGWPPPGIISEVNGSYMKVSESNLLPQEAGPNGTIC